MAIRLGVSSVRAKTLIRKMYAAASISTVKFSVDMLFSLWAVLLRNDIITCCECGVKRFVSVGYSTSCYVLPCYAAIYTRD